MGEEGNRTCPMTNQELKKETGHLPNPPLAGKPPTPTNPKWLGTPLCYCPVIKSADDDRTKPRVTGTRTTCNIDFDMATASMGTTEPMRRPVSSGVMRTDAMVVELVNSILKATSLLLKKLA
nr:hypothetical protein Iba_chr07bCG2060 [Ipomoea batatas]